MDELQHDLFRLQETQLLLNAMNGLSQVTISYMNITSVVNFERLKRSLEFETRMIKQDIAIKSRRKKTED